MSARPPRPAIVQAQEHSAFKGTPLLVLLAIASHAYADGCDAYPGMERIARLARVSERTCQRNIDVLVEAGELRVHRKAGPYGTNLYELTDKVLDWGQGAAPAGDVQVSSQSDAQTTGGGDVQVSRHPDVQVSGSVVREAPPRHLAPPPRHSRDGGNPTNRAVHPDTQVSPKPSLAVQEPSSGAGPPRPLAHEGGDHEEVAASVVAADELRRNGLEPADYPEDHLPVAVQVAGDFGDGAAGLVGALAYAKAMAGGDGARQAVRAGHEAARDEREGVAG